MTTNNTQMMFTPEQTCLEYGRKRYLWWDHRWVFFDISFRFRRWKSMWPWHRATSLYRSSTLLKHDKKSEGNGCGKLDAKVVRQQASETFPSLCAYLFQCLYRDFATFERKLLHYYERCSASRNNRDEVCMKSPSSGILHEKLLR